MRGFCGVFGAVALVESDDTATELFVGITYRLADYAINNVITVIFADPDFATGKRATYYSAKNSP